MPEQYQGFSHEQRLLLERLTSPKMLYGKWRLNYLKIASKPIWTLGSDNSGYIHDALPFRGTPSYSHSIARKVAGPESVTTIQNIQRAADISIINLVSLFDGGGAIILGKTPPTATIIQLGNPQTTSTPPEGNGFHHLSLTAARERGIIGLQEYDDSYTVLAIDAHIKDRFKKPAMFSLRRATRLVDGQGKTINAKDLLDTLALYVNGSLRENCKPYPPLTAWRQGKDEDALLVPRIDVATDIVAAFFHDIPNI